MKALLLIPFLFCVQSFANAPVAPVNLCELQGGLTLTALSNEKTVVLCQFGVASIAADDLAKHLYKVDKKYPSPIAIEIYSKGYTSCDPLGTSRAAILSDTKEVRLCYYGDGSIIEMATLTNGFRSIQNALLNRALGLRSLW